MSETSCGFSVTFDYANGDVDKIIMEELIEAHNIIEPQYKNNVKAGVVTLKNGDTVTWSATRSTLKNGDTARCSVITRTRVKQ